MPDEPNLTAAYALQTPEDSRKLYADWAETYDTGFVDTQGYILHEQVAEAFVRAGGTGPLLDIGAGTGLCGQALHRRGLRGIDGTDISPEMLERAAEKEVYDHLFVGDILSGLGGADGRYAGIVSSGTFTNGHVGPEALSELLRLLAPGGVAVLSINAVHFEARGFAAELERLRPRLTTLNQPLCRIYAEGATGPHADDKAVLAHLYKRAP